MQKPNRELIRQERRKAPRLSRNVKLGPFAIWGRVLLVITPLVIVSLLIAAFFTPLFAIKQISVVGTQRLNPEKLEATLERLVDKPLTMVSNQEVADLLAGFELIETFALQAEPPHTLRVKVRERQPLLIINQSGQRQMFDAAGVRIAVAGSDDQLPVFEFQGNTLQDPRFAHAVELLLSLPVETYSSIAGITVSDQLTSQLVLKKTGIRVFWGSNSDPLLKAEVLDSLLKTSGNKVRRIDVSSPNAPVVGFD